MKRRCLLAGTTLLVALLIVVCADKALSHHLRGIPHYSYRDNYPETPVYEVEHQVAHYRIIFTYYSLPGQQALDLAAYIKDTVSGKPFAEPVVFRVFGKREDPRAQHPFTAYRNPTNVYKVGWVYEEDGEYYVRLTFTDSIKTHKALFELTVGDRPKVWTWLGGALALVMTFAVVTAVIRKRQLAAPKEAKG